MVPKVKLGVEDPNGYEVEDQVRKAINYPEELQDDLYKAEFWVEAPYHIVEKNDKKWIEPVNIEKATGDRDNSIVSRKYNPFDEPQLFLKASKVDIQNEESILNFCNEYGLFRNKPFLSFDTKAPVQRRLPLDFFIQKINGIKGALRKVDAIQKNDTYELNRIKEDSIKAIEAIREIRLNEVDEKIKGVEHHKAEAEKTDPKLREFIRIAAEKKDEKPYDPDEHLQICLEWKDEINCTFDKIIEETKAQDALLKAKQGLVGTINSEIESIFPTIKLGQNGEFVPGYTSNSLLAVIYFQISEMIRKTQPLEECLSCGSMFTPRKAGAKFCPSENPGERSKCQNRYDQMKYKAKKAIISGEKSIEDVCRQTGRSFAEVSSWVEDIVKN